MFEGVLDLRKGRHRFGQQPLGFGRVENGRRLLDGPVDIEIYWIEHLSSVLVDVIASCH